MRAPGDLYTRLWVQKKDPVLTGMLRFVYRGWSRAAIERTSPTVMKSTRSVHVQVHHVALPRRVRSHESFWEGPPAPGKRSDSAVGD